MSNDDPPVTGVGRTGFTRRNFIKGVIAGGAAVSSAAYLFRNNPVSGQAARSSSLERLLTLQVNGQERRVDVAPDDRTVATTGDDGTVRIWDGLTGRPLSPPLHAATAASSSGARPSARIAGGLRPRAQTASCGSGTFVPGAKCAPARISLRG